MMTRLKQHARPIAIIALLAFVGVMVADQVIEIAHRRAMHELMVRMGYLHGSSLSPVRPAATGGPQYDITIGSGGTASRFGPYTPAPAETQ